MSHVVDEHYTETANQLLARIVANPRAVSPLRLSLDKLRTALTWMAWKAYYTSQAEHARTRCGSTHGDISARAAANGDGAAGAPGVVCAAGGC